MNKWGENCEANYGHKFHIIKGLIEQIENKTDMALVSFDIAIKLAKQYEYTLEEAFTNELMADIWGGRGKGEVTKFSKGIMNKNWIHLQDGTKDNDDYDLIITSNVGTKVGDVITIKGKVFLDKDFGHGYFYKLIIEEGTIEK